MLHTVQFWRQLSYPSQISYFSKITWANFFVKLADYFIQKNTPTKYQAVLLISKPAFPIVIAVAILDWLVAHEDDLKWVKMMKKIVIIITVPIKFMF